MVPKFLYRTAEELESEENRLLTDSIYKSASIYKGAPYEVQSQLSCFASSFMTIRVNNRARKATFLCV